MIITIIPSGTLELKDPENFKGFKIAVEKPGTTDAEIAAALKDIATPEADFNHYWVATTAMKNWNGQPQSAEWSASFDAMLETVKKYGYIDEANGTVKAHVERA